MWVRYTGSNPRWYRRIGNVEPGDERELPNDLAENLIQTEPSDWEAIPIAPPMPKKEG